MTRLSLAISLIVNFISTISSVQANPDIFERCSDSSSYYPRNTHFYSRTTPVVRQEAPTQAALAQPAAAPVANENQQIRAQIEGLQAEMARMRAEMAELKQEVIYGKTPLGSSAGSAPSQASLKD